MYATELNRHTSTIVGWRVIYSVTLPTIKRWTASRVTCLIDPDPRCWLRRIIETWRDIESQVALQQTIIKYCIKLDDCAHRSCMHTKHNLLYLSKTDYSADHTADSANCAILWTFEIYNNYGISNWMVDIDLKDTQIRKLVLWFFFKKVNWTNPHCPQICKLVSAIFHHLQRV